MDWLLQCLTKAIFESAPEPDEYEFSFWTAGNIATLQAGASGHYGKDIRTRCLANARHFYAWAQEQGTLNKTREAIFEAMIVNMEMHSVDEGDESGVRTLLANVTDTSLLWDSNVVAVYGEQTNSLTSH